MKISKRIAIVASILCILSVCCIARALDIYWSNRVPSGVMVISFGGGLYEGEACLIPVIYVPFGVMKTGNARSSLTYYLKNLGQNLTRFVWHVEDLPSTMSMEALQGEKYWLTGTPTNDPLVLMQDEKMPVRWVLTVNGDTPIGIYNFTIVISGIEPS